MPKSYQKALPQRFLWSACSWFSTHHFFAPLLEVPEQMDEAAIFIISDIDITLEERGWVSILGFALNLAYIT